MKFSLFFLCGQCWCCVCCECSTVTRVEYSVFSPRATDKHVLACQARTYRFIHLSRPSPQLLTSPPPSSPLPLPPFHPNPSLFSYIDIHQRFPLPQVHPRLRARASRAAPRVRFRSPPNDRRRTILAAVGAEGCSSWCAAAGGGFDDFRGAGEEGRASSSAPGGP